MAWTGKTFLYAAPWLAVMPPGIYFDTSSEVLEFQGGRDVPGTRDVITKTFGITQPWKKQFNKSCNWWEYTNVAPNGLVIRLYGDTVGPASCKMIKETVEVEEDVPVTFRREKVKREVVRWECPDEDEIEPVITTH